jgi:hypothetical protein
VLVAMGVSAFSGFAQEGAPGCAGAPAGGSAVVLNRTKAAPAKPEIVPADKYPFASYSERPWSKTLGAEIRGSSRERGTWGEGSSGLGAVKGCGAVGDGARGRCAFGEALERAEQSGSWAGWAGGLHLWGWAADIGCHTASREFDRVAGRAKEILGEPQIGDSVRWVVTPISSGSGDAATPILVVKPKMTGPRYDHDCCHGQENVLPPAGFKAG